LQPAAADAVSDFYKDRSVTLIAGYSAGGGFDLYARTLANHLGKHIPGQPRVIVQNMPGAGSTRAASHLYNVAPKDGTVIALVRAPVIEPLVGTGGGAFEATKFTWLGSGSSDLTVCALLGNPNVKTMADAAQHQFTLGGLGPGSDEDMYAKILKKLLALKIQLVTGYPGGAEMILAVERGELGLSVRRATGDLAWARAEDLSCNANLPVVERHHGDVKLDGNAHPGYLSSTAPSAGAHLIST